MAESGWGTWCQLRVRKCRCVHGSKCGVHKALTQDMQDMQDIQDTGDTEDAHNTEKIQTLKTHKTNKTHKKTRHASLNTQGIMYVFRLSLSPSPSPSLSLSFCVCLSSKRRAHCTYVFHTAQKWGLKRKNMFPALATAECSAKKGAQHPPVPISTPMPKTHQCQYQYQ